ncbi:hypothetical protein [Streptomyces sp. NPDC056061]|uniref:hypothetical protein n=1 Tax=Streptomyces sp. NPDC056061 TaxID=3345700 RepID=UPI0035E25441
MTSTENKESAGQAGNTVYKKHFVTASPNASRASDDANAGSRSGNTGALTSRGAAIGGAAVGAAVQLCFVLAPEFSGGETPVPPGVAAASGKLDADTLAPWYLLASDKDVSDGIGIPTSFRSGFERAVQRPYTINGDTTVRVMWLVVDTRPTAGQTRAVQAWARTDYVIATPPTRTSHATTTRRTRRP